MITPSRLYDGLSAQFGAEAQWQHPYVGSRGVSALDATGLMVNVGAFHKAISKFPKTLDGIVAFVVTSYPDQPRHLYHRRAIEQRPNFSWANLVEVDEIDLVDGRAVEPTVLQCRLLREPLLTEQVTKHVLGSRVISAAVGDRLRLATARVSVEEARVVGQALIAGGDYLGEITEEVLKGVALAPVQE